MSQDLEDLLAREGHEDVDALMGWARDRAAELVPDVEGDDELGPLLASGGEAGAAPPRPNSEVGQGTAATAEEEAIRVEQVALAARREASNAAPLPPIPVATPAVPTDELDVDEIEELDMEELEMVDEEDDDTDDEPTAAGPAPAPPGPPVTQPSDSESHTGTDSESDAEPPVPPAADADEAGANSFGPPDGNEHVPEWKAALLSTQTATDQEAAERVKEASSVGPLPEMEFPQGDETAQGGRLEAEDDEVSQHSVDLSDLDTDDE